MWLYPVLVLIVFILLAKTLPKWAKWKLALITFGSITALFLLAYFLLPSY